MGSVMEILDCPVCSGEAHSDFYYKTGEEYIFCPSCGYRRESKFQRDENGDLITKDGTQNYQFDNLNWIEIELKPLACYRIKFKDVIGTQLGALETTEDIQNFRKVVSERSQEIEQASISSYDSNTETTTLEKLIESPTNTEKDV